MSDKRYEANIIRATAVEPANNLETTSAPGVWSIDEVVELQKKEKWPTAGNKTTDVDDVFSTFVYEGNGTAQNINNGINIGDNIAGSVDFDGTGDSLESSSHSFAYGTGDFTVEFWMYPDAVSGTINIFDNRSGGSTGFLIGISNDTKIRFYWDSADRIIDSATISTGQWYHIAVARSSGTTKMFKNGTQIGSDYSDSNNYTSSVLELGQRSVSDGLEFNGKLSNVRVVLGTALYTANFDVPTAPLTAISGTELLICTDNNLLDEGPNNISFTVKGNATPSASSPFTGNTGKGGLVWIKKRNNSKNHGLMDTEQGIDGNSNSRYLVSNLDQGQTTGALINSFNSNGFLVGVADMTNGNTEQYVSWTFRQAPKFFDIVTYTGNGVNGRDIPHNLGVAPGMIIYKPLSAVGGDGSADAWWVDHRGLNANKSLRLNSNVSEQSNQVYWTTRFDADNLNVSGNVNHNGINYVAYLFAHNNNDGEFGPSGDQDIIKCGSISGYNGRAELGFEPQWVLLKARNYSGTNWVILDVMRKWTPVGSNDDAHLFANLTNAEADYNGPSFDATGFNYGQSGDEYIYMAIRRGPLAAPTDATKVFGVNYTYTYDVNGATGGSSAQLVGYLGEPADLNIQGYRSGSSNNAAVFDRLRNNQYLITNTTSAESSVSGTFWDNMAGFREVASGQDTTMISWTWKRAPSYFDMVAYSGTGSARTVSHNLGVVPEMMWVKKRSSGDDWFVYVGSLGNTNKLELNSTSASGSAAVGGNQLWNSTTPTSSVFSVSDNVRVNESGETYIAYLFATVAGVSKVGSYTGDGTTGRVIDCGFTSGAKFVLIKPTSQTGGWNVYDTVRGIAAGNDPVLTLNSTSAESTPGDDIDPNNSGFIVNQQALGNFLNGSGVDYIFYAIA